MFQMKAVEKIKTHNLRSIISPPPSPKTVLFVR